MVLLLQKIGGFMASAGTSREAMELNDEITRLEKTGLLSPGNIANGKIVRATVKFKGSAGIGTDVTHGLRRTPVGAIIIGRGPSSNTASGVALTYPYIRMNMWVNLDSFKEETFTVHARANGSTSSDVYSETVAFWVF